jgi:hypothetical protein
VARPGACVNCGALREGAYCGRCGQPVLPDRISLGDAATRIVHALVDLDRGVLHTLLELFRRPDRVVADYLRGRTIPYTNPAKYFLLALTLLQLVAYWSGAVADFASGLSEGSQMAGSTQFGELLDRLFVLLAAPAVPLLALLQSWLFRSRRHTYVEHLVFALFVCSQQAVIWTVSFPLAILFEREGATVVPVAAFVFTAIYYLWCAHRFFRGSLTGDTVRGSTALLLTTGLYSVILAAAMSLLHISGLL